MAEETKKRTLKEVFEERKEERREEIWELRYRQMNTYKEEHGSLKPQASECPVLYKWIGKMKEKFKAGRMGPTLFESLDKLGMDWGVSSDSEKEQLKLAGSDLDDKQERWDSFYEEIVDYAGIHGHLNFHGKENDYLRTWFFRQIRDYRDKTLKPICRQKLDALSVDWKKPCKSWDDRFKDLVEFCKANHHVEVTRRAEDIELYDWLVYQKQKALYGKLDPDQYKKLKGLGVFKPRGEGVKTSKDAAAKAESARQRMVMYKGQKEEYLGRWERNYELAKKHKEKYGSLSTFMDEDRRLHSWLTSQRFEYRRDKLSAERIKRLEVLGIVWEKNARADPTPPSEQVWDIEFEKVKKYAEVHGHTKVTKLQDKALHAWMEQQKISRTTGVLDSNRIERLEQINFTWDSDKLEKRGKEINGRTLKRQIIAECQSHTGQAKPPDVPSHELTEATTMLGQEEKVENDTEERTSKSLEWQYRDLLKCKERHGHVKSSYDKVSLFQKRNDGKAVFCHEQVQEEPRVWIKQDILDRWNVRYDQLKEYKAKKGHLNVRLAEDRILAYWTQYQKTRYMKGQLAKGDGTGRVEKLIKIGLLRSKNSAADPPIFPVVKGPSYSSQFHIDKWNGWYEKLKKFKEKHGHTTPKKRRNPTLYFWVQKNRKKYDNGALVDVQVELLIQIGVIGPEEDAVLENSIRNQTEEDDQSTGSDEGETSDFGLDSSSLVSSETVTHYHAKLWNENYDRLKKYKKRNGHVMVRTFEDLKLCRWIRFNTQKYIMGELVEPGRTEKLIEIGLFQAHDTDVTAKTKGQYDEMGGEECKTSNVDCDPTSEMTTPSKTDSAAPEEANTAIAERDRDEWDVMFDRLKKYKEKHGHLTVHVKKDSKLAFWVQDSKRMYRLGEFTDPGRVEKLLQIGALVRPSVRDATQPVVVSQFHMKKWNRMYQRLVAYKKKHGHMLVRLEQDRKLYFWLNYNRRRYRAGWLLEPGRAKKLIAIGFLKPKMVEDANAKSERRKSVQPEETDHPFTNTGKRKASTAGLEISRQEIKSARPSSAAIASQGHRGTRTSSHSSKVCMALPPDVVVDSLPDTNDSRKMHFDSKNATYRSKIEEKEEKNSSSRRSADYDLLKATSTAKTAANKVSKGPTGQSKSSTATANWKTPYPRTRRVTRLISTEISAEPPYSSLEPPRSLLSATSHDDPAALPDKKRGEEMFATRLVSIIAEDHNISKGIDLKKDDILSDVPIESTCNEIAVPEAAPEPLVVASVEPAATIGAATRTMTSAMREPSTVVQAPAAVTSEPKTVLEMIQRRLKHKQIEHANKNPKLRELE